MLRCIDVTLLTATSLPRVTLTGTTILDLLNGYVDQESSTEKSSATVATSAERSGVGEGRFGKHSVTHRCRRGERGCCRRYQLRCCASCGFVHHCCSYVVGAARPGCDRLSRGDRVVGGCLYGGGRVDGSSIHCVIVVSRGVVDTSRRCHNRYVNSHYRYARHRGGNCAITRGISFRGRRGNDTGIPDRCGVGRFSRPWCARHVNVCATRYGVCGSSGTDTWSGLYCVCARWRSFVCFRRDGCARLYIDSVVSSGGCARLRSVWIYVKWCMCCTRYHIYTSNRRWRWYI